MNISELLEKAKMVRKWSLVSTTEAGSGHPTSCLSAADLMTVLFNDFYTYDLSDPDNLYNDRLVFSKGHAAPLFYTLYAVAGAMPLQKLKTLRKFDSPLEGHPTPNFKYTEAATGSLGQGLSIGAGMAYAIQQAKLNPPHKPKVYVLLGDGELAEGSVWEAANFASYYKLQHLVAIADINGLGQSQPTMFDHNVSEYMSRFKAFGFETVAINGHDVKEIHLAFQAAVSNDTGRPFVIVAKTEKGKGVSMLSGKEGWHGKALKKEDLEEALRELGEVNENLRFSLRIPAVSSKRLSVKQAFLLPESDSKMSGQIATREVYGRVLSEIGKQDDRIVSLDGDVKNSTYAMDFQKAFPKRFIECFIAEQNMVGVAVGLSRLGKKPFVSTFAAFFTRAFDQIRMAALSKSDIAFVGSHAGVSIGEDGSSQMGLEDIAMFGVILDSVIVHPCDAVSTAKLLPMLASHRGISYLRTLRSKTNVLYEKTKEFRIGGSEVLRQSNDDVITIVAAGMTVFEALSAYESLKQNGILVRVIDCYSIKPIDQKTLLTAVNKTKQNKLVTVEDHYAHGGLGDFVLDAVRGKGDVHKLAVHKTPRSGKPEELLSYEEIDAAHIVETVKTLL